jgi:hypothetical protein
MGTIQEELLRTAISTLESIIDRWNQRADGNADYTEEENVGWCNAHIQCAEELEEFLAIIKKPLEGDTPS